MQLSPNALESGGDNLVNVVWFNGKQRSYANSTESRKYKYSFFSDTQLCIRDFADRVLEIGKCLG